MQLSCNQKLLQGVSSSSSSDAATLPLLRFVCIYGYVAGRQRQRRWRRRRRHDKRADYVYLNVLLLQLCFMRLLRSTAAAAAAGVAASAAPVGAVVHFSCASSVRPSCRFQSMNILQNFLAFASVFLFLSTYCSFYSCYFCAHRLQIKFLALNLKFSVKIAASDDRYFVLSYCWIKKITTTKYIRPILRDDEFSLE